MTYQNNDALFRNINTEFISRNDRIARLGMTISTFQNIPGLVGFWPMSSVQRSTGDAYDLSGQGRTLTYNGNPTYNYYNDLVPYIDFDGSDYLSRADETDLDITGTETIYNSSVRGITALGWIRCSNIANHNWFLVKGNAAPNRAYDFSFQATGFLRALVSVDGTTYVLNDSTTLLVDDEWTFATFKYVPGVSLGCYINGALDTENTASIPASVYNNTLSLNVGARQGILNFTGSMSLIALSANALSNAYINALYQQSRVLFGV